jgi:hypothetical protein
MSPASISPWQLAQTRTHFFASARKAAIDLPTAMVIANDFVSGST